MCKPEVPKLAHAHTFCRGVGIHVSAYKMAAMFRRFVLPFTKRNNLLHLCKTVSSTFSCAKFNTSDNHITSATIKRRGSGNTNSYLPILSVGGFALASTSSIEILMITTGMTATATTKLSSVKGSKGNIQVSFIVFLSFHL